MGMSTRVEGFIPPDEKFQKMFKAYKACEAAGIPIPDEVDEFFRFEPPDKAGVLIPLSHDKKYSSAVKEYANDSRMGFEVHLDKLPKDIKIIRFVNSW